MNKMADKQADNLKKSDYMKIFFKKIKWQYYLFTFILMTVMAVTYTGENIFVFVLSCIIHLIIAFYLGIRNAYLSWLYPISAALFAYLVHQQLIFFLHFHTINAYFFMYNMAFGFFFVFIVYLAVSYLGLGLGIGLRLLAWKIITCLKARKLNYERK